MFVMSDLQEKSLLYPALQAVPGGGTALLAKAQLSCTHSGKNPTESNSWDSRVEIAKPDSDWHLVKSQESLVIKCFYFLKHASDSEAYFSFQKCHFLPQLLTVSLTHRIILAAPNTCICMCKIQQYVKENCPKHFSPREVKLRVSDMESLY